LIKRRGFDVIVKRLWILAILALCGAHGAAAQPLDDPNHTLTIQLENDSVPRRTDMYYTSGERLAYTSPTGWLPAPLSALGHDVLGEGQQRFALDFSQYIFTPIPKIRRSKTGHTRGFFSAPFRSFRTPTRPALRLRWVSA
jgi:hypothetical protein